MAATKSKPVEIIAISKQAREIIEKVSAALWNLGYHAYDSQWMKNPKSECYTTLCYKVGDDVTQDGFVTVCINPEHVGGVFVQILLPERKRISYIPVLDFKNW